MRPHNVPSVERLIRQLERHKGAWHSVAEHVGVSHSWIEKLCAGKIPNPGIETISKVRDRLRDLPREASA
jgi:predicted transcriptional regulator